MLHVFPRIVLPISLPVDSKLWSTLHAPYNVPRLFVRIFVGRPRFVVYPPRTI